MRASRCSLILLVFAVMLGSMACDETPGDSAAPSSQKAPDTSAALDSAGAPDSSAAPDSSGAPDSSAAPGDAQAKSEERQEMVMDGLEGTWVLDSYGPADKQTKPVAGSEITATFAEGKIQGSAGCNSYSAPVDREGGKLKITSPVATRKFCAGPGVMEQEAAYLEALTTVTTVKVQKDHLTLMNASGAEMHFKRPDKKVVEEEKQ